MGYGGVVKNWVSILYLPAWKLDDPYYHNSKTDEDLEVDETTSKEENIVEVENLNATIRKRTIPSLDAQES